MEYMLPTSEEFVDHVAKAIARARWEKDASAALSAMLGGRIEEIPEVLVEESINRVFESLWNGNQPQDRVQREAYKTEATAIISAINLKLLTDVS